MVNTDLHRPAISGGLIAEAANAVWVLRAPLAVSALSFWLLCSPEQIIELYVTLAQALLATERKTYLTGMVHVILAMSSLVGLSVILWSIGRDLTLVDRDAQGALGQKTAQGAILRNLPGFMSAAPLFAVAWGVHSASLKMTTYSNYEVFLKQNTVLTANNAQLNAIIDDLRATLEPTALLSSSLRLGAWVCLGAGVAILFASFWRANTRISKFELKSGRIVGSAPSLALAFVITGALIALFALQSGNAGGALSFDFTVFSRFLGSIVIVNMFLMCFAVFASTLTRVYDRYWAPALSVLLLVALSASYLNSNDNHLIRTLDRPSRAAPTLRSVLGKHAAPFDPRPYEDLGVPLMSKAFTEWAQNRNSRERFKSQPYPVYILAAQGGGLYSANLAALTLARLYDRCPALSDHLFAASGVSGGGVGVGLMSSLLRAAPPRGNGASEAAQTCSLTSAGAKVPESGDGAPGYYETRVKEFLSQDFLSPLGGSALFPDVLQRFIPYPPIGAFDRARAFEASLEVTWPRELSASNPLREGFLSAWSASGSAPMLVLNTTLVEDGRQVLIAPVAFGASEFRSIYEPLIKVKQPSGDAAGGAQAQTPGHNVPCRKLADGCFASLLPETQDLPLSTALGLTARYPLVMPAGAVDNNGMRYRLVDGGYFENSGIETALSIVSAIRSSAACALQPGVEDTCVLTDGKTGQQQAFQFHLVVLTEHYHPKVGSEGLNELMSPVRTLFRTRSERSQLALDQAVNSGLTIHKVHIDHDLFPLPLGWQFSSPTQGLIGAQIGDPAECLDGQDVDHIDVQLEKLQNAASSPTAKEKFESMRKLVTLVNDNRCSLREILQGVAADGSQTSALPR